MGKSLYFGMTVEYRMGSIVWVGQVPYIKEFGFYLKGNTQNTMQRKSFAYKLLKTLYFKII